LISARTDRPRANREQAEIERKLGLLDLPHVAPLSDYVRRLRASRGGDESIPWFDPTDAGVDARILLLLEAPGRRATAKHGSGFISADNDDPTAENAWRLYREAGIDRRADVVVWNVIPWYIGTDLAIRSWTQTDLGDAREALRDLLGLLPNLVVVVLQGKAAQSAWDRLGIEMPVIRSPHPSPQNLNTRPEMRADILHALLEAKALASGLPRGRPSGRET
jgi:uracil-DNA glycosylase